VSRRLKQTARHGTNRGNEPAHAAEYQRLTPIGERIGCVGPERRTAFAAKIALLDAARSQVRGLRLGPSALRARGIARGMVYESFICVKRVCRRLSDWSKAKS